MVFTENIELGLNKGKQNLPGFDDKYANIVDYILKITEEIWEERAVWVIYDTYAQDIPIHTGAGTTHGVEEVVKGTLQTLSAFPDRKMGAEAVIWSQDDERHFYSSHRIGSTATNLGETAFGKATGKKVFFRTIADCLVSENKVIEEWLVRDNLHLVQQLGFDPVEMAKRDTRYKKQAPVFSKNGIANRLSEGWKTGDNAAADLIISLFENVWKTHDFGQLANYYHLLATCHAICGNDLIGHRNISGFLSNLFASFPNAAVHLERITCNEKSNGETEVAARWKIVGEHSGDGLFSPASGKKISMPGISHFIIKEGKISEEWMVFDGFDLLCQIHAEAGTTSVFSENSTENHHIQLKKRTLDFFEALNGGNNPDKVFEKYLADNVVLNITKPFREINGMKGFSKDFWKPLRRAFPDLENQPYILIGGRYEGRDYVSCTGNFIGTFAEEWLGIPPTGQPLWLRYAGHFMYENGRISKAWFFLDMLDVLRQAGFNFLPFKGIQHSPPAPMTGDGIVTYPTNPTEGKKTLDLTNAMLNGLGSYDGKTLESMGQTRFWDVEKMMWYGPSGIGTTRGLKGFEDNHQVPFITAFPDRGITPKKGMDYFAQIGDGNYSCDFGFPAMYGSHLGDGWLGLKATGKKITLRVVDYWRREGDKLRENWVLIDMVDVLEQLGIDVFDLMKKEIKKRENGK